ncbi:AraC family transcriptional regulator [Paenibacillus hemerocallicola]|uniref:AraC family transcriptional regulator n=2 Tax=Paenibacillus hemerocallicola TaxID=1172614 RepID=A0A5C4T2V9_9BACL|nr:AraC family transcriptional regulator [Paenibacillus hemerocallicola]
MMNVDHSFPLIGLNFENGGRMGKARCEPGWGWRVDRMPDYDLWYVLSGCGSMRINGESYPIKTGCCFILRPDDRVQADQDPDDRLSVVYIHFRLSVADGASCPLLPRLVEIDDKNRFESLLNRLLELGDTAPLWSDTEFDWTIKLLLLDIYRLDGMVGTKERASYKHKQILHRLIDLLRQNIGNRPDYDELAEAVHLSKRYVSLLFKRHTGKSLKQYVTKLRMDRARVLLAETTMTAAQIAEAVGYADLYVFSKMFKEVHGVAPTYYRKRTPPGNSHGSG